MDDLRKNPMEYLEMKNKISKIKIPLNKIAPYKTLQKELLVNLIMQQKSIQNERKRKDWCGWGGDWGCFSFRTNL